MKTFLLLSAMMFVFIASMAQKSESDKDCWYNKDMQKNKVPGVSSDRAYAELLQGKTPKPVIVAIIDGADADSGTAWEMGYAFARGVPVIALRTDFRKIGHHEQVNLMLEQSATVVGSTEELLAALYSPFKNRPE